MNLVDNLTSFIERNKLDLYEKTLTLAVSCGVDSMVLMNLAEKIASKYKIKLVICHVNHKKRLQSEIEEEYIRSYCMNLHKLYVYSFKEEDKVSANFQEYARKKRYEFFYDVMVKENSKYLLVAHHLNDDIETSLFHIMRSSSLDCSSGMKEVSKFRDDLYILRPLLNVKKEDIYDYALKNDIKYFEDSSNMTDDYQRNRIRHNIIPALLEENNNFYSNFLSFKEKLSYASSLLDEKRDEFIKNNVRSIDNMYIFNKDVFDSVNNVLKKEILFELLKKYYYSNKNIEEILKYINSEKKNLLVNYKDICVVKEDNIIKLLDYNYKLEEKFIIVNGFGTYEINDEYMISFEKIKKSENNLKKINDLSISNVNEIWYNSNSFPFIVRNRKDGDTILLSSGHKKVKDLLIDSHLSVLEKDNTFILEDKNHNIISVLGLKKSSILSMNDENNLIIKYIRRKK